MERNTPYRGKSQANMHHMQPGKIAKANTNHNLNKIRADCRLSTFKKTCTSNSKLNLHPMILINIYFYKFYW